MLFKYKLKGEMIPDIVPDVISECTDCARQTIVRFNELFETISDPNFSKIIEEYRATSTFISYDRACKGSPNNTTDSPDITGEKTGIANHLASGYNSLSFIFIITTILIRHF